MQLLLLYSEVQTQELTGGFYCSYAFLPLDPIWPGRKFSQIVAEAQPGLLLTRGTPGAAQQQNSNNMKA